MTPEDFAKFSQLATESNFDIVERTKVTWYTDLEGCDFYCSPGKDPSGLNESMLLEVIARDCLCTGYGHVAVSDKVQKNRGCSVGFTSSIGCTVQESGPNAGVQLQP